jgi:hypothetical protein
MHIKNLIVSCKTRWYAHQRLFKETPWFRARSLHHSVTLLLHFSRIDTFLLFKNQMEEIETQTR